MTKSREIKEDSIYHIYNRSVDKQTIFRSSYDFNRFYFKIMEYTEKSSLTVLAYCILPNHFHLLLRTTNPRGLATAVGNLCNSYAKYFNCAWERIGHVWQGRYNAKLVDDKEYLQTLLYYVNLNPIKHKLAHKMEDWPWSSHHDYLSGRKYTPRHFEYLRIFTEYAREFPCYLKRKEIDEDAEFVIGF
ncbi:MAG: transposase [Candidatus Komeilibacteria bacterium]|nr:transposase [Candidatus Komeilibacteria bacterium]